MPQPAPRCCYGRGTVKLGGQVVPCLVCRERNRPKPHSVIRSDRRGVRHHAPGHDAEMARKRRERMKADSRCIVCGSTLLVTDTLCGGCRDNRIARGD
jgi:hypothetical protein